jgi:hypothetical protein
VAAPGEPVALPLLAAVVVIAVMVVFGGGRYPVYVDVMVYVTVGLFTWTGVREAVYKVRFRREDRSAEKQGGTT